MTLRTILDELLRTGNRLDDHVYLQVPDRDGEPRLVAIYAVNSLGRIVPDLAELMAKMKESRS